MLNYKKNYTYVSIVVFFTSLLTIFSCQKTEYSKNEIYFRNDSAFTKIDKPLTGKVISFYLSGEKELEENYVNGIREGKSILYYKNGNIWEEISYKNGLKSGFHISYFEKGPRGRIKAYKNGIAHGVELHYYLNGELWREMDFDSGRWVFDKTEGHVYFDSSKSKSNPKESQ